MTEMLRYKISVVKTSWLLQPGRFRTVILRMEYGGWRPGFKPWFHNSTHEWHINSRIYQRGLQHHFTKSPRAESMIRSSKQWLAHTETCTNNDLLRKWFLRNGHQKTTIYCPEGWGTIITQQSGDYDRGSRGQSHLRLYKTLSKISEVTKKYIHE